MNKTQHSKWIAYCLRHGGLEKNLKFEKDGWCQVEQLLKLALAERKNLSLADLEEIVASDSKQRYALSEDKKWIRANQGHSMDVSVNFKKVIPPIELFHGTSSRYIEQIKKSGLMKMNRHYVHLSRDQNTASDVGSRHGERLVMITIDVKRMVEDEVVFYLSENGVFLTDFVDSKYFKKIEIK